MNHALRKGLPTGILALGIAAMIGLIKTRPQPKKSPRSEPGALVEVIDVQIAKQRIIVEARGTISPARQVTVGPEVGGKVVWLSDELIPGGRFTAGQTLLRVDARDYKLAVDQQVASMRRAESELELEQSRKTIAEREWELFGDKLGKSSSGGSVALREPQMATAKTAVKAASSGLQRAQLAVSKTVVKAPFNALVQARQAEVGQILAPGTPVAVLVGTDVFWVQVSVPVERLAYIDIPGLRGVAEDGGSPVTVIQEVSEHKIVRKARVIRLLGDVDPAGRMARVLVEIRDPLGLKATNSIAPGDDELADSGLPLLVNAYVTVRIQGTEVDGVATIPRDALRDGHTVFIMNADDQLDMRDVQVAWRQRDQVLISSGLSRGERVIVSPVAMPVQGAPLRLLDDKSDEHAAQVPGPTDGVTGRVARPASGAK